MKVRCFSIEWDTDGESLEACGLPSETIIEVDDLSEDELEDRLCDVLSDKHGFLLDGCSYEVLEPAAGEKQ